MTDEEFVRQAYAVGVLGNLEAALQQHATV
jgi:hypothetical protein